MEVYETRGKKYRIEVHKKENGCVDIRYFTNGRSTGASVNFPEDEARKRLEDDIKYSEIIDGIRYRRVQN